MQKNIKNVKPEAKEKLPANFHIEIDRSKDGLSLSVAGVYSIVDFSEENVILRVKKGRVLVSGTGLSIAVYENKTVEISGRITEVKFV